MARLLLTPAAQISTQKEDGRDPIIRDGVLIISLDPSQYYAAANWLCERLQRAMRMAANPDLRLLKEEEFRQSMQRVTWENVELMMFTIAVRSSPPLSTSSHAAQVFSSELSQSCQAITLNKDQLRDFFASPKAWLPLAAGTLQVRLYHSITLSPPCLTWPGPRGSFVWSCRRTQSSVATATRTTFRPSASISPRLPLPTTRTKIAAAIAAVAEEAIPAGRHAPPAPYARRRSAAAAAAADGASARCAAGRARREARPAPSLAGTFR